MDRPALDAVTPRVPLGWASSAQLPRALDAAQRLDVSTSGLRDPQPVQGELREQHMFCRRAEPVGDQQGAEFVAVEAYRVGLKVRPRPPHVRGR